MRSARGCLLAILATTPLIAGSQAIAAGAFEPYRWTSRLLVISAPDAKDRKLAEQSKLLDEKAGGVRERDVVIIRVIGDRVLASDGRPLQAAATRTAAGLAPDRFGVALIGKDGGEKLKRGEPLPPDQLFRIIDAMPMRQDEMKRADR